MRTAAAWDLRARAELELRRRQERRQEPSLAERYADDPIGYVREKLGWEPWEGTRENPGQVEVLNAYRLAIRQQIERRDYQMGLISEDELRYWSPGSLIKHVIRVEAGHTVGKCVEASELMTLSDGSRATAGSLVGTKFELMTLVEGVPTPVNALAEFNRHEKVLELVTDSGRRIVRNARHPLWATRATFRPGRRPLIEEGAWCGVGTLEPGMLVAMTEALPAFGRVDLPDVEVKLLAYLIGDGGYTRNLISFSQAPGPQLEEFRECAESYGCAVDQISTYDWKIVGEGRSRTQHNPVLNLLRAHGLMGKHSRDKRVPAAIFSLSRERMALFLSRLLATDGWACVDRNGVPEVGFCSASEGLVRDVQELLLRFGVHGRITARTDVNAWTLYIRDRCDLMQFVEQLGIFGKEEAVERVRAAAQPTRDRKRAAIQARPDRPRWCHKNAPTGTRWEKVVSVNPVGVRATIAIEVPEHHTYLTSFWEHNTKVASGVVNHFFDCFAPALVYCFAPTAPQIDDLLFKEIRRDRRGKGLPGRVYDGKPWVVRSSEHFVKGRATSDSHGRGTERAQGQHGPFLMFVIDEAEGVADYVFDAIESMESGGIVIVLMLANPRTRISRFHKAKARSTARTFRMSCLGHPNVLAGREIVPDAVRREWVESMIEKHCEVALEHNPDEETFEVPFPVRTKAGIHPAGTVYRPSPEFMFRVLGRAPANLADNTFVPVGRYEAAVGRTPPEIEPHVARIGIDVARFGNDFGTLYARWNGRIWRASRLSKRDTNVYARKAKALALELKAKGVTDVRFRIDGGGGFGGGVVDKLKIDAELLAAFRIVQVLEVHFNGKPHDPKGYADLVTEMYAEAAETVRGIAILDPPETLEADLCERTYDWVNKRGRDVRRLSKKKDFRKDHDRSPDDGDGFALAAAPDFVFEHVGARRIPSRSQVTL